MSTPATDRADGPDTGHAAEFAPPQAPGGPPAADRDPGENLSPDDADRRYQADEREGIREHGGG